MAEQRIRQGDFFQVVSVSSLSITLSVLVIVDFDNGRQREYRTTLETSGARAGASKTFGNIEGPGNVTRAVAVVEQGAPQRGEVFVLLRVRDRNTTTVGELFSDYIYGNHVPAFPHVTGPGPGDGAGFIKPRAVADDIAPADIQETLSAQNTLRRIDGFIWYYHASGDVADRQLRVTVRDLGVGLPTGMTSGTLTTAQIWPSAGVLTLSANQEGMMLVSATMGNSFAVTGDNGTRVFEDVSVAQPLPFPYWANKADVGEFFFDVTDEEAADRHTIYILQEEWID